jgi:hypothetical protein
MKVWQGKKSGVRREKKEMTRRVEKLFEESEVTGLIFRMTASEG